MTLLHIPQNALLATNGMILYVYMHLGVNLRYQTPSSCRIYSSEIKISGFQSKINVSKRMHEELDTLIGEATRVMKYVKHLL